MSSAQDLPGPMLATGVAANGSAAAAPPAPVCAAGGAGGWFAPVLHGAWSWLAAALRRAPRPALLMAAALGAAVAAVSLWSTLAVPTVWTSTTVLSLDDPYALATAPDNGPLLKLNALRAEYSALATTQVIAGPVALKLGLAPAQVAGAETVVPSEQALLLDVTARWSTPLMAQQLSRTTARTLQAYVQSENSAYGIPAPDQLQLQQVDPTTPAAAIRPSVTHAVTRAVELGVLVLVVAFVVIQLVRQRWVHR